MKWKIIGLTLAVALAVALVAVAEARNWGAATQYASKNITPPRVLKNAAVPPAGWYDGKHLWGRGACGSAANATLYVATRQLTITGNGIGVSLTVDVVNRNASSPYGRIVYGTGSVQLGGKTYTARTVAGMVGPNSAVLMIYTGTILIQIRYFNGQYVAIVRTFGQPGYQRFNGTATLNISSSASPA